MVIAFNVLLGAASQLVIPTDDFQSSLLFCHHVFTLPQSLFFFLYMLIPSSLSSLKMDYGALF